MSSFRQQVSSSIRILGWNRDASARATHLKAADGNVPFATIERKSMSTKTSIKRVALVAAAALTIGGFSAVSANAAAPSATTPFYVSTADSAGLAKDGSAAAATESASGVAGAYNYVEITAGASAAGTVAVSVTGSAAGALSVTTQPTTGTDTITVAGGVATDKGLSLIHISEPTRPY